MKRRRFLELTALSTTAVTSTALAGCTGARNDVGGTGPTTSTNATSTTTTRADSGDHPTTSVPGCPDVLNVSEVYCPGDDGPVSVTRSAKSMPTDGGSLTLTVENTSDGSIGLNPYAWGIYRLTNDGHWEREDDDRAHIEPWQELEPGGTLRWVVASDADQKPSGDAIPCVLDLDPGNYGWAVELKPGDSSERIGAGAGFLVE